MSLPPKFAAHRLLLGSTATATTTMSRAARPPHTLEVFLDYNCPFSAKIFRTLTQDLAPEVQAHGAWNGRVALVFRHQIQPWHPTSTMMHEAALAVLRLQPDAFWPFSAALFRHQAEYFDAETYHEGRGETYQRLAQLAHESVGVEKSSVLALLEVPSVEKAKELGVGLNDGNAVTADVKLVTKMARLTGVHVSPTVIWDGVVQNEISSSWTLDQWKAWLEKNVD